MLEFEDDSKLIARCEVELKRAEIVSTRSFSCGCALIGIEVYDFVLKRAIVHVMIEFFNLGKEFNNTADERLDVNRFQ